MARLVRMCTQCGATDDRRSWASTDEAADDGAFSAPWTCATCAWTEFELVDARTATSSAGDTDEQQQMEHAQVAASAHHGGPSGTDPTFRSPA